MFKLFRFFRFVGKSLIDMHGIGERKISIFHKS
jgi:hypothetical protein